MASTRLPKAEAELAGHIGVRPKAAVGSDTNEASLTAAIQQAPDDDNLRLVLADHLLERSDVRGELIRLGVELKALEPREEELPRKQLDQLMGVRRDLETLVASHGKRLAGDIARHATDFTFDRGFVGAVTMSASAFSAHGDRLFAQSPIHTLQLRPINDALVKKLAGCSGLARVRHLRLGNPGVREAKPVKYAGLASSRHLGTLESLDLTYSATLPADWEETFAGLAAPKLKSIAFDWSVVSPRIFTGLARNQQPMPLQRLSFAFAGSASAFNYVFPGKRVPKGATDAPAAFTQGFSLLGTAPTFNALSVLSLEGWPVPEPALLAWLDGPNVKSIEQLDLRNTGCGPTFVAQLARKKGLKLKRLKIGVEDSKGIAALLHSDAGALLEVFDWTSPDESKEAIEQVVDAALALPKKHPLKKLEFDAERVLSDKKLAEVRRRFAT